MKKLFLSTSLAVLAAPVLAQHNVELEVGYSTYDDSEVSGFSDDARTIDTSIRVFIPRVETDKGPIAEAGFLSQASQVYFSNNVNSIKSSSDSTLGQSSSDNYHYRITTLGVHGVTNNGWVIGGEVSVLYSANESSSTVGQLKGGYYLLDTALLTATVGRLEVDDDSYEESVNVFSVNYHQVFNATESLSFALEAKALKVDDLRQYKVEGTAYFTPSMGLTLGLLSEHGSFDSETDVSLKYHYFLNDRVGLKVSYTRSESEAVWSENVDVLGLGIQVNL